MTWTILARSWTPPTITWGHLKIQTRLKAIFKVFWCNYWSKRSSKKFKWTRWLTHNLSEQTPILMSGQESKVPAKQMTKTIMSLSNSTSPKVLTHRKPRPSLRIQKWSSRSKRKPTISSSSSWTNSKRKHSNSRTLSSTRNSPARNTLLPFPKRILTKTTPQSLLPILNWTCLIKLTMRAQDCRTLRSSRLKARMVNKSTQSQPCPKRTRQSKMDASQRPQKTLYKSHRSTSRTSPISQSPSRSWSKISKKKPFTSKRTRKSRRSTTIQGLDLDQGKETVPPTKTSPMV